MYMRLESLANTFIAVVLFFAERDAALCTMGSFQALLICLKVHYFWRRRSAGRQQKS